MNLNFRLSGRSGLVSVFGQIDTEEIKCTPQYKTTQFFATKVGVWYYKYSKVGDFSFNGWGDKEMLDVCL